ncbi:LysR substrate-binding domain-containing protein [Labrys sp. KB_33_2]|jgi:LysR family glycine cleavage system transcriptional activator|uniref:LysR substrate-binding domain-containing protein n=1 Tax=Labrys sp. KB_33_2 TaxID=3237479 RepID=UPI003F920F85
MQTPRRLPSLNAVRVFEAAARLGSLKAAGEELGVTASAVSHQVRHLEEGLGVRLFARSNNAIELTAEGARFAAATAPALDIIAAAASALQRDANEVLVRASVSLALRWLIPRLGSFRQAHPSIRVRLETPVSAMADHDDIDLVIGYSRAEGPAQGGTILFDDICVVVAAPDVAARYRDADATALAASGALISATQDDWDWRRWAEVNGVDWRDVRMASRFEIDDAAWEAASAGLGMTLASPRLIERELRNGLLTIVGLQDGLQLGNYWVRARPPIRRGAELFLAWLLEAAGEDA